MWPLKKRKPIKPLRPAVKRNVIPALQNDFRNKQSISKSIFIRGLKRVLIRERNREIWQNTGQSTFKNYFNNLKMLSGINIVKEAKIRFKTKGHIKILELGMAEGQHVPDFIHDLQSVNPKGRIEFHDLSFTKKHSDANPEILQLEKEGIIHRHKGVFELFPTKNIQNCDIIYTRFGPFWHLNIGHFSQMTSKLSTLLSKGGIAVLHVAMEEKVYASFYRERLEILKEYGFEAALQNQCVIIRKK